MGDNSNGHQGGIEQLRGRQPGEQPNDPYENVVLSELPPWWRAAIIEFKKYGLRPYQPPQFEDGTLKYEIVTALETELGVDISVLGLNTSHGDDWTVRVDGVSIGEIGRHRSFAGYTVFEMASGEFADWIRSEVQ